MIKALIFDFDGTLADTIPAIREAINNTMRYYGYDEKSYDEVRFAIGSGARTLIKRILPHDRIKNEDHVTEVLDYYNNEYSKTFKVTDSCYPGMHETVAELHRRGYKIGILSNKPDIFVRELTDMLFGDGEITFAAGQTGLPIKPDPTSALMTAEKLRATPDECAFIGDSDVDIQTGHNAMMMTVGCSWGYRGAETLREAGADVIIDRPEELLSIF